MQYIFKVQVHTKELFVKMIGFKSSYSQNISFAIQTSCYSCYARMNSGIGYCFQCISMYRFKDYSLLTSIVKQLSPWRSNLVNCALEYEKQSYPNIPSKDTCSCFLCASVICGHWQMYMYFSL